MLSKDYVLFWEEVQTDLYVDREDTLCVFGIENDLYLGKTTFYIRYPDGSEQPLTYADGRHITNAYDAIDKFNEMRLMYHEEKQG